VPIEWTDRLDIETALRTLEEARSEGITTLGFTGGEPFLYPEFLYALCRRAVQLDYRFDKIMTNGLWFSDLKHLTSTFERLASTGYSGKLGLSVDKFHFQRESGGGSGTVQRLGEFCRAARTIFDRDTIVSLSYSSRSPEVGLEPVQKLAAELNAVVEWSDLLGKYLLVSTDLTMTLNWNHLAPVERAEHFAGAWDGCWFEEDYCEGPGQALVVNPRGEVKPCCGFASDLDQLTIGNIYTDSVARIIQQGRDHPYVGRIFREGLASIRAEVLEHSPDELPGQTSNHCFFCWYVLTRGLVRGVHGGGGQIGAWTGVRPNRRGELITLGNKLARRT